MTDTPDGLDQEMPPIKMLMKIRDKNAKCDYQNFTKRAIASQEDLSILKN